MANERAAKVLPVWLRSRGRFFFLFLLLLIDIVSYPYAAHGGEVAVWFRVLNGLLAVASVYAVSFHRKAWIFALILGIPVAIHRGLVYETAATRLGLAGAGLTVAFDILIIVLIFKRAFDAKEVTADAVFAAVSVYLLIGHTFANIFGILVALQHGAFYLTPLFNQHVLPLQADLVYYSFATLTSLGAVGISPLSDQARSLSIIESILGILYLGVLVSRLITVYKPRGEAGA